MLICIIVQKQQNQVMILKTSNILIFFIIFRIILSVKKYRTIIYNLFLNVLDQPKNHLLEELTNQRKINGPCFITQTSSKESKHQFYKQ